MPSEKILESKKQAVTEVVNAINGSVAGVVVEYKGVNVADDTKLRKELREAGVDYKVVKNTLLRRAADETGLEDLKDVLVGTTALAVSNEDHAAAARILKNFAKDHESFNIKGGYLEGEVIALDTVNELADLPPFDILMATVCNAFNAPIAAFARVIQAVVDKKEEEGEAVDSAEVEEAAPAEAEAPAEE